MKPTEKLPTLAVKKITADPELQPRAGGLNNSIVEEYAERLTGGDEFPPVIVYQDGAKFWLSEGFHRYAAHVKAGIEEIAIEKRKGDRQAAKLNALASNKQHGLRRTNADKRRAVELMLKDWPAWSDRRIADHLGVSNHMVADARQVGESPTCPPAKREGIDGKAYPVPTPKPAPVKPVTADDTDPEPQIITQPSPVRGGNNFDFGANAPQPVKLPEPEPIAPSTVVQHEEPEPTGDPSEVYCKMLSDMCREFDDIIGRIRALNESPYARFTHWQSAVDQARNARETLWAGRPMYECPYCAAAGEAQPECRCCGGLNVCTKISYKNGVAAVGGAKQ